MSCQYILLIIIIWIPIISFYLFYTVEHSKPLKKMRFHIIGSSLKKEGVKKILDLGGDPVRKIDDKLAACISTKGK